MSDELLTAPEAARFLRISLGAFYALRRRQRIPNASLGRRLLFRRQDLLRPETPPPDRPPDRPPDSIDWAARGRAAARGEKDWRRH